MTNIVQTVTSECGRYKVEIEQRSENVFKLVALKWHEVWVDGRKLGEGWEAVSSINPTFTDSLGNAEQLAAEMLRTLLY
jgi:hypothetical protein